MEFFTSAGRFWLPEHPDRRVHGDLNFDDDGIQLQITDPLRAPLPRGGGGVGGSPQFIEEPVVHGQLHDGTELTLLQASGYSMPVDGLQETWRISFVLSGRLLTEDHFEQVTVVFDYLMAWVRPPGIVDAGPTAETFTINSQRSALAETALPDGRTVKVITGVEGRRDESSVHFQQWCAFEVEGPTTPLIDILNQWVRPLQDLLVVCLGRPVRMDTVLLRPPDQDLRMPLLRLSLNAVQPPAARPPSAAHIESYSAPTLFTYARSPELFADLIGRWFSLVNRLPMPVTLFCGPFYAPFIYSQHRYASTFQSAEGLARAEFAGREKKPSEHQQRVQAVTEALKSAELDAETIRWAASVVQGRNDKPLHALMAELIAATGEVGRRLLEALPDLPNRAAAARTNVSHPATTGPAALERHWIGEALVWVVRVHLLAHLGLNVNDLSSDVSEKPAFQQVLQELSALAAQSGPAAEAK